MSETTTPAKQAWWRRLYRQFVGLPPHLAWLAAELPAAVPWLLRYQRLVFVLLPVCALLFAADDLLPYLGGSGLGETGRLVVAAVFIVGLLGAGVGLSVLLGAMALVRLVRGPARSWRLVVLIAVALLVVGLFAYALAPFVLGALGR